MDSAKSKLNIMMNSLTNASMTRIIVIVIVIFIIVGISFYINDKLSLRKKQCKSLNKMYKNFPTISSFNDGDSNYQYTLKDYYIKTAYNACSIGKFKNSFVDMCALKEVIRQGYRCLDMAVYSVNNDPVVSTSTVDSYDVKQTYNSIPFDDVCDTIANYAFSGSSCPNPNDPLLIHLRVLSQNSVIYKKMAEIIYNRLNQHVLGKKYSYEYDGRNLGDVKLNDLQRKVIIMIDKSNPMYEGTDLDEYVNIASNSVFMQAIRYDNLRYAPDMQEQVEFNKRQMTIVLPNLSENDDNPSAAIPIKYGCQMAALSAQNYDDNLKFYDEFFNKNGCAFVLKPENLRYIPITNTMPNNPPANQSYKDRKVSSDFYSFKI
jgi:hypothetical protein